MTVSPRISARPQGSPTVAMSGGRAQPISGASPRASQPDGASTKASPIATAAWGAASRGASTARTGPSRPCSAATAPKARTSDSPVAAIPVQTDSAAARPSPGMASSWRHGPRSGPVAPKAGKCPNPARRL
ncbi:hypothetical protein [Paracoccus aestuarii]|uniref:hypothetical protein n=1 Tax=Paracoccus aestuarii TaxID=453842 RepID=UPI00235069BE|nr:hypothetical protein [Paracoccus aestuarii]